MKQTPWHGRADGELRKVVQAPTLSDLKKRINEQSERGWTVKGEMKPHGAGYGILMIQTYEERMKRK